ncbi:MAG: Asp-tRNA(Asn)/Glu-tRNA(Gln) amidotransferase GatCAB subunit B, partial [Clostridia bacterium]|nr:Asp-tRNA(Asn)/Glu-tRNA(Gln) amidotransferase GatCAB subunit B [Clostridia bacterium]
FPEVKRARYIDELGLTEYDADLLVASRAFCDCFEGAYAVCGSAKEVANWLISDCMNILNRKQMTVDELKLDGKSLGELIKLCMDGKVNRGNAKKILTEMFDSEEIIDPAAYAEANGYIISNDTGKMDEVIKAAVAADPKAVADFKGGKEKALMALFGKCMKELKGNCDPQVLREALLAHINSL